MSLPDAKTPLRENCLAGLLLIAVLYVLALWLAVQLYHAMDSFSLVWRLLAADCAATIFIYLAGLILNNASVYDPYWSVAPIAILTLLAIHLGTFSAGALILLALIWFWGIRLTANWAVTFDHLGIQDWRYDKLRGLSGRLYPLVSLTGIHLFPTLIVYLALIPAVYYIQSGQINALTLAGYSVCLIAIGLQAAADAQMHRHRKLQSDRRQINNTGLWQRCRHPNYLGEILMWWGVYLVMLSALPARWYLAAGAVCNTLMFLVISIPLAEKRLAERKAGFAAYREQTPMLLPFRFGQRHHS